MAKLAASPAYPGYWYLFWGLGFALLQLRRLRGETRAARAARAVAEETNRRLRRDLTGIDLTRLKERIPGLVELHRAGDRSRGLDRYPEIRELFLKVRRQRPNLSEKHRRKVQNAMVELTSMQSELEALEGDMPAESET